MILARLVYLLPYIPRGGTAFGSVEEVYLR